MRMQNNIVERLNLRLNIFESKWLCIKKSYTTNKYKQLLIKTKFLASFHVSKCPVVQKFEDCCPNMLNLDNGISEAAFICTCDFNPVKL